MLEITGVSKSYTTGDFTQVALDGVSLTFRRSEFVAILGASGSGKTTLLNIVGGLDTYDDGALTIEGAPTTGFTDRDWDAYRNHRVGFVFQNYHLIPHQSVLANVEIALTLSGVGRKERRGRALAALEEVGLGEHAHKRPNQLSGGQMQRVAIARALVNDPEVVLADEPTGALDSVTSGQIMELLAAVARDRLVIMVTHNADLAERYATRTITLGDGAVLSDSGPPPPSSPTPSAPGAGRRTRMGAATALGLSLANLLTKRGRTFMTAFAGSIGIIGIAAILALANGVNDYIRTVEEDTLSVYPLSIQRQGVDMSLFLAAGAELAEEVMADDDGRIEEVQVLTRLLSTVGANDLASLKGHIDSGVIAPHVTSVHYAYDVDPQIYSPGPGGYDLVHPDPGAVAPPPGVPRGPQPQVFTELMADTTVVRQQYETLAGRWPQGPGELLVVLTPSGDVTDFVLYAMGLRDRAERDAMLRAVAEGGEPPDPGPPLTLTAADLMDVTFELAYAPDYYVYDEEFDVWVDKRPEEGFVPGILSGEELRVAGVVRPREDASATALQPGLYYTPALTREVMDYAADSAIVASQLRTPDVDVFTGRPFTEGGGIFAREDFRIEDLVEVDEEQIAAAITVDEAALTQGLDQVGAGLTLPPLTLPEITIDPGDLPAPDVGQVLAGIELDVDPLDVEDLAADLAAAFEQYSAEEPEEPEAHEVGAHVRDFLESEAAAGVLGRAGALLDEARGDVERQLNDALAAYIGEASAAVVESAAAQIAPSIEAELTGALRTQAGALGGQVRQELAGLAERLPEALAVDEEGMRRAFTFKLDEDELTEVVFAMVLQEERTAQANLRALGYAEVGSPDRIDIYPRDFEGKAAIIEALEDYNEAMAASGQEDKVVTYTDFVGTLMSSVTDILNVITYVLVAFVAISLVVSSIMIGVVTYISVLERRQEIGILRAVGASKGDIRRVFNAETLLIGFLAGVLGIAATLALTLPANAIISARFGIDRVAVLPWQAGVALVGVSMFLTFLAGLIPASAAARKDPVEALRAD